ncbi:RNA polymerase factor sigma-54 [Deferribacteraceae bacterium V6Fe1]|nr:RNA polymerase factor sigma-54 [Deferribacteraceae bacterium V6Fe1]
MNKMKINLETKLGQKLLITPQMKQSLKILQMPYMELITELNNVLEENPVLEEVEVQEVKEDKNTDEFLRELQKVDWQDYFSDLSESLSYIPDDEDSVNFDKFVGKKENLYEHLLFQLNILGLDDYLLDIGKYIIGNIDENGYLTISISEIVSYFDGDEENVLKVLSYVREFDPSGVGSVSLIECLLKQLEHMGVDPIDIEIAETILKECYEEIAFGNHKMIAEKLGLSEEYVGEIIDFIKRTDPKPGLKFSPEGKFVVPDVYILEKDGKYEAVLNENEVPAIKLNSYYIKMLKGESLDSASKEFIEDKVKNAIWFIKSMNQRKKAILKVVEALIKHQKDFLDKGLKFIKPLRLKDIAQETGLHESTVSRVTSNKYAMCKYGVIELKSFFMKGLSGHDGSEVSVSKIKDLINDLIEQEPKDEPYSDQKIVEILSKKGIKIARRTVAKYRDELNIPGTSVRKKMRR